MSAEAETVPTTETVEEIKEQQKDGELTYHRNFAQFLARFRPIGLEQDYRNGEIHMREFFLVKAF